LSTSQPLKTSQPSKTGPPKTGPSKTEFWIPMDFVAPERMAQRANQVEADGWDGLKIFDTQCLHGDAMVMMTTAALATDHLMLSLATSNPVTRHPSVAASAICAIAAIAPRRIFYGIGRGDSSLAHIGGAPAKVGMFERYVAAVRKYTHGEPVSFDEIREWRLTDDVSTITLGDAPEASVLKWLDHESEPPPIEVFASGPRVLGIAGRLADRVSFGLGANPGRLKWAIETAHSARERAGLDPRTLEVCAIVCIGVCEDLARARRSVANMVAPSARFSVINGPVKGPVTDSEREVYEAISRSYDMNHHGAHGSQVTVLTDEFIDDFAVVGAPQRCVERILELHELGIDCFMLSPPFSDADEADIREGYRHVVEEVIPAVRAATHPAQSP